VRSIPGLLVALITASPPASEVAATGLTESRRIRDADIRFFESRIVRDPGGALDLVRLGGLLLLRYRDRGDEQDLVTAERAARRALSNRGRHNDAGWRLLTAALSGQHRFLEARRGAERQVAMAPEDAAAQAILGEVLLELGEYPAADRIFRRLTPRRFEPALAPRYARWLELRGQAGAARRLLESARDAATGAGDLIPFEQRAWYDLRLAELAFRFRAWRTAAREIENGLARVPDDWRLLALAARLALRTGTVDRSATLRSRSALIRPLSPPWETPGSGRGIPAGPKSISARWKRCLSRPRAGSIAPGISPCSITTAGFPRCWPGCRRIWRLAGTCTATISSRGRCTRADARRRRAG
jgi:hypothetical protein